MKPAELRDRCLSLPGAEESFLFGPENSVFKVAAVIPGYNLNKRHWNTVILDGSLAENTVGDMLEGLLRSGREQVAYSTPARARLAGRPLREWRPVTAAGSRHYCPTPPPSTRA